MTSDIIFTEDGMGSGKAFFEVGFNSTASEERKKFGGTASEVYIEKDRYESPSTQYYQKLEGKLKHDSTGGQLGSYWGENIGIRVIW